MLFLLRRRRPGCRWRCRFSCRRLQPGQARQAQPLHGLVDAHLLVAPQPHKQTVGRGRQGREQSNQEGRQPSTGNYAAACEKPKSSSHSCPQKKHPSPPNGLPQNPPVAGIPQQACRHDRPHRRPHKGHHSLVRHEAAGQRLGRHCCCGCNRHRRPRCGALSRYRNSSKWRLPPCRLGPSSSGPSRRLSGRQAAAADACGRGHPLSGRQAAAATVPSRCGLAWPTGKERCHCCCHG